MSTSIDITNKDLEQAIVDVLANYDGYTRGGWVASWSLASRVSRQLGLNLTGYVNRQASARFDARVKRTLDAMAKDGKLAKIGARDHVPMPDGRRAGTQGKTYWALPDVAARIVAEHEQAKTDSGRRHAAYTERVAKLTDWAELHRIDAEFGESGGGYVKLSLDEFERILIRLEP